MEPLHPNLRKELKRAHPSLTDDVIDRHEELLSRRMECHPEKDTDTIAYLDRELKILIEQHMPQYSGIYQQFSTKATRPKRRRTTKVKIKRCR